MNYEAFWHEIITKIRTLTLYFICLAASKGIFPFSPSQGPSLWSSRTICVIVKPTLTYIYGSVYPTKMNSSKYSQWKTRLFWVKVVWLSLHCQSAACCLFYCLGQMKRADTQTSAEHKTMQQKQTSKQTKKWHARWQRADKRHSEAIFLPSNTDCRLSQHIAGLGSSQLGASTFAPRVTASQLGMALIDVQQLRESKHRHDNVFVSALLLPMLQRWTGAVLQYTQMSPSRFMGSQVFGIVTKSEFNSLGKKGADFSDTDNIYKVQLFQFIHSTVPNVMHPPNCHI